VPKKRKKKKTRAIKPTPKKYEDLKKIGSSKRTS
jgi:hypothetical protein